MFTYLRLPADPGLPGPRVMLVDDHDPFRDQIRDALTELGMQVVAEADDGALVPLIAPHAAPVVILMDVRMRGIGGIQALEHLRLLGTQAPTVILTGFPDPGIELAARAAGAVDVLVKGAPLVEIVEAVRQAWQRLPAGMWAGPLHG